MRLTLLPLVLAAPLVACGDTDSPVGPTTSPVASVTTVGTDPIDDVINRIVPSFGDNESVSGLLVALDRVKNNETAALAIAEQYLARLERENPAFAPDADATRLALRAAR